MNTTHNIVYKYSHKRWQTLSYNYIYIMIIPKVIYIYIYMYKLDNPAINRNHAFGQFIHVCSVWVTFIPS